MLVKGVPGHISNNPNLYYKCSWLHATVFSVCMVKTIGWYESLLTYWGRSKMADILQTTFCYSFSCTEVIHLQISLKSVLKGPNNDKPTLDWIMAWRWSATSHSLNQRWLSSHTSRGLSELTAIEQYIFEDFSAFEYIFVTLVFNKFQQSCFRSIEINAEYFWRCSQLTLF